MFPWQYLYNHWPFFKLNVTTYLSQACSVLLSTLSEAFPSAQDRSSSEERSCTQSYNASRHSTDRRCCWCVLLHNHKKMPTQIELPIINKGGVLENEKQATSADEQGEKRCVQGCGEIHRKVKVERKCVYLGSSHISSNKYSWILCITLCMGIWQGRVFIKVKFQNRYLTSLMRFITLSHYSIRITSALFLFYHWFKAFFTIP